MEHLYPEEFGPDAEIINMIEYNVLAKNPWVNFDDISELDEKILKYLILLWQYFLNKFLINHFA